MKIITFLSLMFLFICSCNNGNDPVFENSSPNSEAYKQELLKQVLARDPSQLTFVFKELVGIDGENYLRVSINGKNIKAEGLVLVANWNKIENIRKTNGMGYRGAELRNLKLSAINNNNNTYLKYEDVEKIVD